MTRLLAVFLVLAAPARAQGLDELLDAAAADRWQGRWDAIVKMSHLPQDDQVFHLRRLLVTDERPRVREAIAWASERGLLADGVAAAALTVIAQPEKVDSEGSRD